MKRWIWSVAAAAACLLGNSGAKAEYVIIRVILNKSAMSTPASSGGFLGGPGAPGMPGGMGGALGFGGGIGGPPKPGGPGGPPGAGPGPGGVGMVGMNGGGPPPPPGGPGRPGGAVGMGGGSLGPPPGGPPGPGGAVGMGGSSLGPPPAGGPGTPGGGATGFVGGSGPGMPGMPGSPGNAPAATPYTLGPDDYVTVVVPIHKFDVINSGGTYGKGPDGRPERLAKPGRFHFETKYGITFIDANQNDIILDYKGLDPVKKIDLFPDTKKLLQVHKSDTKKFGSPEGHIQLAEWCLEVGMPDEAMSILDKLNEHPNKESFKPTTATAVQTYQKVKDLLAANIDKSEKANQWKDRLGYQALSVSKHYAIVHQENTQESANRRLDALEMNFKTVYTWFAMRGRALPAPSEKLVAVIVGDASEFRRYRDTFEASNLVSDGFHARRENLAVFSGRRLDKASVNFEQLVRDVYRVMKPEDLFKGKLPNLKEQPNAPETFADYARASTLALVDKALQQEAEIAAATHEGTKQLFAETGLLPRNVLAPEWVRFGIAALFEMPKGPFPGGGSQLKVALHPGGGGPNWAYMRYYEEMREKNLINDKNAADLFIETVIDQHFRLAHQVEMAGRLAPKGTEEGDSKATPAEELYARARTLGWSVVYFMAKTKFSEFERFLEELAKLPRDAELDAEAVITSFCVANGISTAGLNGTNPDINRFMGIGLLWKQFMDSQTSPTRAMKIDTLITKPDDGTGSGRPGFPGGPPGPGGPGGPPGPGGPGRPGG